MTVRIAISPDANGFDAQQKLADALPVLVMMSDPAGNVTFFNRRWYEFTGQDEHAPCRHTGWQAYMHPDDGESVAARWHEAVGRGERVVKMRYRLRHGATGAYRWFSARAEAMEDEHGGIAQWIGTAVDVEDETVTELAVQRLLAAQTAVSERYQRAALQSVFPDVPGMRFDAEYRASQDELLVGGDWYDAFRLDDGRIAVSIGDVVGHGIDAALAMTKIRQSGRAVALWSSRYGVCEPAAVLDAMEAALVHERADLLATAIFGIIDGGARTFTYASAGHPPGLLKAADGTVRDLPIGGTPLGLPAPRPTHACDIADAAAVVLYTDGVVEGSKDLDEGLAALRTVLQETDLTAAGNVAAVLLGGARRASDDDAAILVVQLVD